MLSARFTFYPPWPLSFPGARLRDFLLPLLALAAPVNVAKTNFGSAGQPTQLAALLCYVMTLSYLVMPFPEQIGQD